MSITNKLNEIEIAKNNIKASLEAKGKTPGNDIRNYAAVINSLNGDIPSSTNIKIIVSETEPEDTAYQGFWIQSSDYTYNEVHIISDRADKYPSSVNIIRLNRNNKYKTVIIESNVSGGLYLDFYEILITDENNEVLWETPIYYGNDTSWVNITPSDIHWIGITVDYVHENISTIFGSYEPNELLCYSNRIRCNLTDDGEVVAYYGDDNYDNTGNVNLQVMVEQPIVYVKVDNITIHSDGKSIAKADYYIADGPLEGYTPHMAFNVNGTLYRNIYLNAYQGSIVNNKLSSYNTGASPTVGKSGIVFRAAALRRGSYWRQWTFLGQNLELLLCLFEYKTFNFTNSLANGRDISSKLSVGLVTMGSLNEVGTGYQNGNKTASLSFTYRYRENPYGNIVLYLDGITTNTSGFYLANSNFESTTGESTYREKILTYGINSNGNRNICRFCYIYKYPYLFIPYYGASTSTSFIPNAVLGIESTSSR